jgi:hypothetical protein
MVLTPKHLFMCFYTPGFGGVIKTNEPRVDVLCLTVGCIALDIQHRLIRILGALVSHPEKPYFSVFNPPQITIKPQNVAYFKHGNLQYKLKLNSQRV